MEKAGFWARLVAYIIDAIIVGIVAGVIQAILITPASAPDAGGGAFLLLIVGYILTFVWGFAYYVYFWTRSGQTPGKKIMGLKVITVNGDKLTTGKAIVRVIGYAISSIIIYLGFLWSIWDKNKQTWHDMIAGTYVVKA